MFIAFEKKKKLQHNIKQRFGQRMILPPAVIFSDLCKEVLQLSTRNSVIWASTSFRGLETWARLPLKLTKSSNWRSGFRSKSLSGLVCLLLHFERWQFSFKVRPLCESWKFENWAQMSTVLKNTIENISYIFGAISVKGNFLF